MHLKALSLKQLQVLVEHLAQEFQGAQLQEVIYESPFLYLIHYRRGPITMVIHTQVASPLVGYIYGEPQVKKKEVKPLTLFLKAHFVGRKLDTVNFKEGFGRVFTLEYYSKQDNPPSLEARMIPHGFNLIARYEGDARNKKILSWAKVEELKAQNSESPGSFEAQEFLIGPYLEKFSNRGSLEEKPENLQAKLKQVDPAIEREKKIQNIERLTEKLTVERQHLNKPWYEVGQFLKETLSLEIPEDWVAYVNKNLSISLNIQQCFEKYQDQKRKQEKMDQRLIDLAAQKAGLLSGEIKNNPKKDGGSNLLFVAKVKGRTLHLSDQVHAVLGKSAKDNLAILRKAQSHDLWVHLRDQPSAHAILHRPKKFIVSQEQILQVAEWVLRATVRDVREGDRHQVIYTEVRHVKPIKGDKLGRVHYQNEISVLLRVR